MVKWRIMVKKMKAIYHTLNYFSTDITNKCMLGECWIATTDISNVQKALEEVSSSSSSEVKSFLQIVESIETPPTFMRSNKFTKGFQNLIDSYGVASYKEVNPALYSIITFPFLFGVMFGDVGHGMIIFLFGLWMVLYEKKLSKWKAGEIFDIFFGGRYIILLMGMFAIYSGFIYNDIFSKSMNIFGSAWYVDRNESEVMCGQSDVTLDPRNETGTNVYPLGLDPVWQVASNKIIFHNGLKMKLSIILGVVHMIFGVCMALPNHIHLKRKMNIILEFMPQFLFLACLFGYMVFMMFFKWTMYGATMDDVEKGTSCAPSILIFFIDMILQRETAPQAECETAWMFEGQRRVQVVLVLVALICIPWLLLGKILYIWYLNKTGVKHHNYGHPGEPMSEVVIYQIIHTIEYMLNCISHTASYLRLWALSLAHARKLKECFINILVLHNDFITRII